MNFEPIYQGVSQNDYNEQVFNLGVSFIEKAIKNPNWQQSILQSKSFWIWWIAKWQQRELDLLSQHAKVGSIPSLLEWLYCHNNVLITQQIGFVNVIYSLIKKEVKIGNC